MSPGVGLINLVIAALGLAVLVGLAATYFRQQPYARFLANAWQALPYTLTAMLTIGLTSWLINPLGRGANTPGLGFYDTGPIAPALCGGTRYIGNPQTHLYYPPSEDLPLLSPREQCFDTPAAAENAGYTPARQ